MASSINLSSSSSFPKNHHHLLAKHERAASVQFKEMPQEIEEHISSFLSSRDIGSLSTVDISTRKSLAQLPARRFYLDQVSQKLLRDLAREGCVSPCLSTGNPEKKCLKHSVAFIFGGLVAGVQFVGLHILYSNRIERSAVNTGITLGLSLLGGHMFAVLVDKIQTTVRNKFFIQNFSKLLHRYVTLRVKIKTGENAQLRIARDALVNRIVYLINHTIYEERVINATGKRRCIQRVLDAALHAIDRKLENARLNSIVRSECLEHIQEEVWEHRLIPLASASYSWQADFEGHELRALFT